MKAKKNLGQNFLKNDNIINDIVNLLPCTSKDLILEIGPGMGALTKKLSKIGSQLVCIEIDTDMKKYLENFNVIYDDILNVDLNEIINIYKYENLYIVGNLPYYITTPIIEKIIKSNLNVKKMIFMVQKEVADRLSSSPGSSLYGYMTIFLNHYYDVKKEFFVSKSNFNPVPKVDSAIISLNKKEVKTVDDNFFSFLKLCFQFKRKTLMNNLNVYGKEKVLEIFKSLNISSSARAEELTEEDFLKIYKKI